MTDVVKDALDQARSTLLAPAELDNADLEKLIGQMTGPRSPGRLRKAGSRPGRTVSIRVLAFAPCLATKPALRTPTNLSCRR